MAESAFLVIDDDGADLELLQRILGYAFPGAHVRATTDPHAALEICRSEQFGCVLIDYNMPSENGLLCAQRLHEAFPYLPIVLTTGVGDELLAARAVTSGVAEYIPKSRITAQSLRRTIEHAIQVTDQARIIGQQKAELENFAYALAHDFRQPIRQIRTFCGLIGESLREDRKDGVEEHLAFLDSAAKRLSALVDVMSQYTLLNQPPAIGEVDLNSVVEELNASLAPYLAEHGGILEVEPLPIILGNEALMTQVLQNLIVNGIKYNKSVNPLVSLAVAAVSGECVIVVKDNGIGIAPEYIDEVFKPLVRLHNYAEYSGTGLGLTLARKAILAQGGDIWCRSEPGIGSEFYVQIPLASAATARTA